MAEKLSAALRSPVRAVFVVVTLTEGCVLAKKERNVGLMLKDRPLHFTE